MSPRGRRAARDQASRERNARAIHTRDALEGGIAEIRRAPKDGSPDPSALWKAFVSALPHWFAPSITTVPAEGPSAEWFDRSLPHSYWQRGADLALVARDSDPAQLVFALSPFGEWVRVERFVTL